MKLTILCLALVGAVSFACPPPPAPGYDGGPVGDGPSISGDGGGFVDSTDDTDSSATSGDATTGSCTM